MNLSRTSTLRLIRYSIIGLVIILIIAYAIFRSLDYIHGPKIEIFQPIDGTAVSTSTITIIGKADRVNSLSMNGKPVFIDEAGNFNETIIVFSGLNIITFDARDRFNRDIEKQLEIVGTIE